MDDKNNNKTVNLRANVFPLFLARPGAGDRVQVHDQVQVKVPSVPSVSPVPVSLFLLLSAPNQQIWRFGARPGLRPGRTWGPWGPGRPGPGRPWGPSRSRCSCCCCCRQLHRGDPGDLGDPPGLPVPPSPRPPGLAVFSRNTYAQIYLLISFLFTISTIFSVSFLTIR